MKIARNLTYLGLIPLVLMSLCDFFRIEIQYFDISKALIFYSGLILSFLGGIYFGFGIKIKDQKLATKTLIISVLPQIYVWLIFIFIQQINFVKIFLIIGFLLLTIIETYYFNKFLDEEEFLKMRCKISMIVVIFLSLSINNEVYKCDFDPQQKIEFLL